MRLIEKIILILLGVSLLPLLLAGSLLYFSVQTAVTHQAIDHLSTVATIEQKRLADIRGANLQQLEGFRSRVLLRTLLDHYTHTHDVRDQSQINSILDDAKKTVSTYGRIVIMDTQGNVVASTDRTLVNAYLGANNVFLLGRQREDMRLINPGSTQKPVFYLSGPLQLNNQSIGVVTIEASADKLLSLVQDYTGLGQTGEITLAQKQDDGHVSYITPLRFDPHAAFQRTVTDPDSAMSKALDGVEMTFTDVRDYRNQRVLAATRYVSDSKWGLVVKIDRAEAFQPSDQLRSEFLLLAFMCSVGVTFVAIAMARRLTQPIVDIDEVAEQAAQGKLSERVVLTTRDEIGNLATTFNVMLDNLEALDEAKSDFVSLASHQLRTPASGVKALTGLLLNGYAGPLSEKQRSYLQQVFDGNERQIRVINDLLNVAMIESGRLQLKKSVVDLGKLLDDTAAEQRLIIESRHQTVQVNKPAASVKIQADAEKLGMVLDNLLSNASKYTPEGGNLKLNVHQAGSKVRIEVSDTGVGIAAQDLKKLFQKFSQVNNHLDDPRGGSAGLGLYLTKKIVELHGGKISVTSVPNKGTTFTVELPA